MRRGRTALLALRDKYEHVHRLRVRRAEDPSDVPQDELRALATRFPGALRELDRLPPGELEERRVALDRALGGAPGAAWMEALATYHAWLRLGLALRAGCPGRTLEEARRWVGSEAAQEALDACGGLEAASEARLALLLRPPGGRLNRVALAAAAEVVGRPAAWLEGLLDGSVSVARG